MSLSEEQIRAVRRRMERSEAKQLILEIARATDRLAVLLGWCPKCGVDRTVGERHEHGCTEGP